MHGARLAVPILTASHNLLTSPWNVRFPHVKSAEQHQESVLDNVDTLQALNQKQALLTLEAETLLLLQHTTSKCETCSSNS
jgi:hypothetical protein